MVIILGLSVNFENGFAQGKRVNGYSGITRLPVYPFTGNFRLKRVNG
jgi:hypothetical protein